MIMALSGHQICRKNDTGCTQSLLFFLFWTMFMNVVLLCQHFMIMMKKILITKMYLDLINRFGR